MITRTFWRELGIMYFSIIKDSGQYFEFVSPLKEFTLDSPTVPVVIKGSFQGENRNRTLVVWPALPARTEGGMAFPGKHRLTSLEDGSIYACVCELPRNLTEVTPDMFKLTHHHYVEGEPATFSAADGYVAVIVMSGVFSCDGTNYTAGQKINVGSDQISISAVEAGHVVSYCDTSKNLGGTP